MEYVDVDALNVGDEVGISSRYSLSIGTVARRTATQVVVQSGQRSSRFNKRGREIGSTFGQSVLVNPTEARETIAELRAIKERKAAQQSLRERDWSGLTKDQCEQVESFLKTFETH